MVLLRMVVMVCGWVGDYGYGFCGLDYLVNSVVSCFILCFVLWLVLIMLRCLEWSLLFGGWLLAVGWFVVMLNVSLCCVDCLGWLLASCPACLFIGVR